MSIAVVTGAARGIGAAIARALAEQGHSVALLDRDLQGAMTVENELKEKGRSALAIECDVSQSESVKKALAQAIAASGQPSILVNNAGFGGPFHRVDEVSDDEWDSIIAINLKSVFLFSRELLPLMKNAGYGRIINIASIQGLVGAAKSSTYVAAKHGMIGYTKAIAAEWGSFGITANAICPGYVNTAMGAQDEAVSGHTKSVIDRTPVKRLASPIEIAALALHLLGPESGYINGSSFVIDGGIMADVGIT